MHLLTVLFSVWISLWPMIGSSPPKCLNYGNNVALSGKLQRVTFAGPPNYESVSKGDRPEVAFVIDLPESVCVEKDEMQDAEKGVQTVQLVFTEGEKEYERYKPFLGRKVEVTGKLFHAQTGHHHTSVLIEVTGMKQIG